MTTPPPGPTSVQPPAEGSPSTPSDPRYREAVVDLLGTLAYGELTAYAELAADSRLAPTTRERIAMARLSARELEHFERLVGRIRELGADPEAAMTPYMAALDTYHERTRSRSWPERLVKAYVADGIRTDFYREIAQVVDEDTRRLVTEVVTSEDSRDDALVAAVREALEADPGAEGRLALWARRLMGEALAQAQLVAVQREALASLLVGGVAGQGSDLVGVGRMVGALGEHHAARMARLGLAS